MFFVRSGYVGNWYNGSSYTSDYSKLNYPGHLVYYWSRTSSSNASYARDLASNDAYAYPSGDGLRYNGFSLRCLYGA